MTLVRRRYGGRGVAEEGSYEAAGRAARHDFHPWRCAQRADAVFAQVAQTPAKAGVYKGLKGAVGLLGTHWARRGLAAPFRGRRSSRPRIYPGPPDHGHADPG